MAKRKEWRWNGLGAPNKSDDPVEVFKRSWKNGVRIIEDALEDSTNKKNERNQKIEEMRLKMGLKPSKTFGEKKEYRRMLHSERFSYGGLYGDELYHHGILGQIWGRRRWQNEDGSLTEAGRAHYGYGTERERNRHAEKMEEQSIRLTKAKRGTDSDAYKSKYDLKKLQIKQDKQKQRDAALRYKHDEEMARIKAKEKADADKAKYKDAKQKRDNDREKLRNEYKLEKLKAKNERELSKYELATDREDMRRDYYEERMNQDYDYLYDRRQQKNDYRTEKYNAKSSVARVAAGVAAGIGAAYIMNKIHTSDSNFAKAARGHIDSGKQIVDALFTLKD